MFQTTLLLIDATRHWFTIATWYNKAKVTVKEWTPDENTTQFPDREPRK